MRQQRVHRTTGVIPEVGGPAPWPVRRRSRTRRGRRGAPAEQLSDGVVEYLVTSVERFHDHLLGETSLALAALADAAPAGLVPVSIASASGPAGGSEEQLAPT